MYFIISGSVREQFTKFYLMKGIGNVINSHDLFYQEPSRAAIKTVTETKVMQIKDKMIYELMEKYPDFKKKWLKSVFPYALKLDDRAEEFLQKDFTERQLRRFI